MLVLGIESSCDETGLALYDSKKGLIAHQLFSQIPLHQCFGGVVPELASRDHIQRLLPLTLSVLKEAGFKKTDLQGIAYTAGPGLAGSLMVGATFGRALAYALNIPSLGVHHMEGHLLAPLLEPDHPNFPFIALLVSGGHTQLYWVEALGQYTLLGESLDDAAGEAFDKTAKILGLPYPGGPHLAKLAEQGNPQAFSLPRPMTDKPGLDFSFSGLKTAVVQLIQQTKDKTRYPDIAASFQAAIIDTLKIKCERAFQAYPAEQLVIAGGVSANLALREAFNTFAYNQGIKVYYPRLNFATDNGAMIALAGCLRLSAHQQDQDYGIRVKARWPMSSLPPLP